MFKKRRGFIESRAAVMAGWARRGADELATLRHVLEKRDELGKKREYDWGIKYSLIFKVGWAFTSAVGRRENQPSPRDSHDT